MSPQPQSEPTGNSHSTGPRTGAGKAASSRNSLRHGLASGTILITGEDAAEWESLHRGLTEEWGPTSSTEHILVDNLARHHWLVQRALRLQGEALAEAEPGTLPASFALLLRYQTTNERAFSRALKALEDIRKTARQFVSQNEEKARKAKQSPALTFLTKPFSPFAIEKHLEPKQDSPPRTLKQTGLEFKTGSECPSATASDFPQCS